LGKKFYITFAPVWKALPFLASIRLGLKGLPGTNTPPYFAGMNWEKSFITLAPVWKALPFLTSIRLGCKGLPGTNTLAYFANMNRKKVL
jgi:hypothetical protein